MKTQIPLEALVLNSMREENNRLREVNAHLRNELEEAKKVTTPEEVPYEVELEFGGVVVRTDVIHLEKVLSKIHLTATEIDK